MVRDKGKKEKGGKDGKKVGGREDEKDKGVRIRA